MAQVEIIAVGTELLLGQLLDTNTNFIAQRLADAGLDVVGTHTVGDNRERIARLIRESLSRVDGVITTGGVGPTVDDLTKEAVCDALGVATELHEPSLRAMQAIFARFGREMRENNRKQAEMPVGATVLPNPNGTAPGFVAYGGDGKFVASMPGVPREMKPMLVETLVPLLRERLDLSQAIYTRVVHTVSIGESEIDHRIDDLFRTCENPKIAVLAHEGLCDVKIMAKAGSKEKAEAMIAPLQAEIESRLREHVYGCDDVSLESAILERLQQRKQMLAAAESCTGGRVVAALTRIPGASLSVLGGIIAYANEIKIAELGVHPDVIAARGAVSEQTALAMASGVRERLGAHIGIATTGIAGPSGATPEKPVGLVFIAIDDGSEPAVRKLNVIGNRESVMRRTTTTLLGWLWHRLKFE